MSYQGKKSIPHITVSGPGRCPRSFVGGRGRASGGRGAGAGGTPGLRGRGSGSGGEGRRPRPPPAGALGEARTDLI